MCILMQCPSLVPSLKALKESFSMKEIPSTCMLLHLAPNSTFFTSLPRTMGLTYGFDVLTILSGMLSLGSLLSKWFFCWRYTFVIMPRVDCSRAVSISCSLCSRIILRISFRIFPSRFNSHHKNRTLRTVFACLFQKYVVPLPSYHFCDSPNFHFLRVIGGFFLSSTKVQNFYHIED